MRLLFAALLLPSLANAACLTLASHPDGAQLAKFALPAEETMAVVLLAALPTGANVYLMARQFATLEGPIASALVLSTTLAALTTPLALALLAQSMR